MKQSAEQFERQTGIKELKLVMKPDTQFDEIVEQLKVVLTIPDLPGVRGCSPCLSGLDRFLLESVVLERVR